MLVNYVSVIRLWKMCCDVEWCWCFSVQVDCQQQWGNHRAHMHARFTLTLLQCSTDLHCSSLLMWDADDKVEIAGARIEPSLCRRFNEEDGLYRESFCDGEFELLLGVSSVIDRSHTLNAGDLRSRWYTIINGVFLIRFTRVSTDGLIINVRRLNIQRPQRLLGFALLDIRSGQ